MSTDPDWFRVLRNRTNLEEINFWRPGVRSMSMAKGTPWLFLIRETNQIWGFGFFSTFDYMPIGVAWDTFREANGFDDFSLFVRKIASIKGVLEKDAGDIGCAVLSSPQYFNEPIDYGRVGRIYRPITSIDARTEEGAYLRSAVVRMQAHVDVSAMIPSGAGKPVLVIPRFGQATFRIELEKKYLMRCAVTGERTRSVLGAAHIKPYSLVKEHSLTNGLLLRKDIHKLFDDGYVTVTPDRHFLVSKAIRDEFEKGRDYYALHEKPIRETVSPDLRPAAEYLEWHATTRFKG